MPADTRPRPPLAASSRVPVIRLLHLMAPATPPRDRRRGPRQGPRDNRNEIQVGTVEESGI
ncbi:hypothetical protein ACRE_046350 [Hapsidospora chrysogenum ATCC 11550]|uniref:Uncharacterized protein n=1 Tax=Hapsidospora chrysogenum (strain ATCC 11550 / CBS 779.69 / DSM 880 / IAM 14645 / JCM 23072 / IMI 49137) TaxID=857340 RepID=A0A086T5F8_HAPC1|nr:hypothetical protein ACRE_046350 [Hapsidospora chrysogenum ATCC 11550]